MSKSCLIAAKVRPASLVGRLGIALALVIASTGLLSCGGSDEVQVAASTTPADTSPPTAPSGLTANAVSTSQINLNWAAATDDVGVVDYRVERCQGTSCTNFVQVATTGTVTSYNSTGLSIGTTYRFRVRAADAVPNLGPYSGIASASTLSAPDTQPPTAPSGLTATAVSDSQINLGWSPATDNVGVTQYRVERCQGAGCTTFAQIGTTLGTVNFFNDIGLLTGTTYRYQVRATDVVPNVGPYSNVASATTLVPDTVAPSVPTGLTATAVSSSRIDLGWSPSTDNVGVTGYRVYRNNALLLTLGNVTSYQDTGLTPSTMYTYAVSAIDLALNESGQSASQSATTPAPSNVISVSLVPSRTSGVAPLTVFFDATATTSPLTPRPFHELEYRWDFGDPAGGATWSVGSRAGASSKNSATGPVAAHVFETAGNYTVTLTVTDGTNTDTATVSISVDPDDIFAGTNTRCFSNTTDFTGCPGGATSMQITTNSYATVVSHQGTNRRLLLRRGHVFTTSSDNAINAAGPGIIGAFGSGARPIIRATSNDLSILQLNSASSSTFGDWRFMDLDLDGQNRLVTGISRQGNAQKITYLRLTVRDTLNGFLMYYPEDGAINANFPAKEIAFVDSTITNSTDYGIFLSVRQFAVLGSVIDTVQQQHIARFPYIPKSVISNSYLANEAPTKHLLKLAGQRFHTGAYNELIVVSDNKFRSTTSWGVIAAPQNDTSDERVRNVIFERNWHTATSGNDSGLVISATNITARNNLFDSTGGSPWRRPISMGQRGIEPAPDNIWIYNNSFYAADSPSEFFCVGVGSGSTNVVIRNNLAKAQNATSKAMIVGSGSYTATNNSLTNTPGWVSNTPTVPSDFSLAAGSSAINAGIAVPVFTDFFRATRPQAGGFDLGFMERP